MSDVADDREFRRFALQHRELAPVAVAALLLLGVVAMANSGPNTATNGSQFFLVYQDVELQPAYGVVGKISKGMDVLEKVAAAGTDDSNGPGDGRPKLGVTISQIS